MEMLMVGPFGGWEILIVLAIAIIILGPPAVFLYLLWYRAAGQKKTNIQQKIEQLSNLKEQGLISEEEYEQKKKQLLGNL